MPACRLFQYYKFCKRPISCETMFGLDDQIGLLSTVDNLLTIIHSQNNFRFILEDVFTCMSHILFLKFYQILSRVPSNRSDNSYKTGFKVFAKLLAHQKK
jgi:hypothetical protein